MFRENIGRAALTAAIGAVICGAVSLMDGRNRRVHRTARMMRRKLTAVAAIAAAGARMLRRF